MLNEYYTIRDMDAEPGSGLLHSTPHADEIRSLLKKFKEKNPGKKIHAFKHELKKGSMGVSFKRKKMWEDTEMPELNEMTGGQKAAYKMGKAHGVAGSKKIDPVKSFGADNAAYYHTGYQHGSTDRADSDLWHEKQSSGRRSSYHEETDTTLDEALKSGEGKEYEFTHRKGTGTSKYKTVWAGSAKDAISKLTLPQGHHADALYCATTDTYHCPKTGKKKENQFESVSMSGGYGSGHHEYDKWRTKGGVEAWKKHVKSIHPNAKFTDADDRTHAHIGKNKVGGFSHSNMSSETLLKEAAQETNRHRVSVTVSDPNHPMVSKRKDQIEKRVQVTATGRDEAKAKAEDFYKKKGYKVHDVNYHSQVKDPDSVQSGGKVPRGYEMTSHGRIVKKNKGEGTLGEAVAKGAGRNFKSSDHEEMASKTNNWTVKNIDRAGHSSIMINTMVHPKTGQLAGISRYRDKKSQDVKDYVIHSSGKVEGPFPKNQLSESTTSFKTLMRSIQDKKSIKNAKVPSPSERNADGSMKEKKEPVKGSLDEAVVHTVKHNDDVYTVHQEGSLRGNSYHIKRNETRLAGTHASIGNAKSWLESHIKAKQTNEGTELSEISKDLASRYFDKAVDKFTDRSAEIGNPKNDKSLKKIDIAGKKYATTFLGLKLKNRNARSLARGDERERLGAGLDRASNIKNGLAYKNKSSNKTKVDESVKPIKHTHMVHVSGNLDNPMLNTRLKHCDGQYHRESDKGSLFKFQNESDAKLFSSSMKHYAKDLYTDEPEKLK